MKLVDNKHPVRASWLWEETCRLDAKPFLSGAIEKRKQIEALKVPKERLPALTAGHGGGIYNGPMFSRTYVDDPSVGVPFLGSSDMLHADLSKLPLLSKKEANSRFLSYLRVEEGMTLVSCSGTIGRMVYVRSEMSGMWSSQHIMKIVPDPDRIPPGYLYAYLSSSYGVPLVVGSTYGAIIQHIEPQHLANLPVPRLGAELEGRVHSFVQEAAEARTRAAVLLREAQDAVLHELGIPPLKHIAAYPRPLINVCAASAFAKRGDAFYYNVINQDARGAFDKAQERFGSASLSEVSEVFIPGIFKRLYADDPNFGNPYVTGADVFTLAPVSERFLIRRVAVENRLLIHKGMILIQEAGQLGGLIGRSVQVGRHLNGFACSNNMVRICPRDEQDGGYLYAVLSSEHGVRLIAREAAGSSIPHMEVTRIASIQIPWPNQEVRHRIGALALEARDLRDRAIERENAARELVETTIRGSV